MSKSWRIHPTAIIDPTAEIAPDVEIGPFCTIGAHVQIGAGTVLHNRIDIIKNTIIGRDCELHSGVVLGGPPQDKKYQGEETYVVLGNENILREYVTIHRSTGEGTVTRIGNDNLIMAYAHIGHNCDVGSNTIISSYAGISGHVTIEDYANLGGLCGIHQHTRVGMLAMVGGMSGVVQDVYPYMIAAGNRAEIHGINTVGLKRAGVSKKVSHELKQAYTLLYRMNLNTTQALQAIEADIESSPELDHLLNFIRATQKGHKGRGNITPPME